jgi:hypothetical protein
MFSKLSFIRVMECLLAYTAYLDFIEGQQGIIPNSNRSTAAVAGGRQPSSCTIYKHLVSKQCVDVVLLILPLTSPSIVSIAKHYVMYRTMSNSIGSCCLIYFNFLYS